MKHSLIISFITAAFCACQYQQSLYPEYVGEKRCPVEVSFDWSDCPEAAPQSMSLYLFPADGSHYTRHEFAGRDGGQIFISPGYYAAVAVNSDNEQIKVINEGIPDSFRLVLRNSNALSSVSTQSGEDEQICPAPGPLWIAWISQVEISDDRLIVKMSEAFCRCSVDVRRITNPEVVRSVRAVLSGTNSALSFDGSMYESVPVSLLFDFDPVGSDGSVAGHLLTFGHCGVGRTRASAALSHRMTLEFTLCDGSTRYKTVDVTDQVHTQPIEHCHLVIDSITVPLNVSDSGIDLTVSDWNEVDLMINL